MEIRLYLDEDVWPQLAAHLRRAGYDVLTTADAGRANQGIPDDEQLAFAVAEQRVLFSHNHCDLAPLDQAWKAAGREHFGIILSPQLPPSQLCRRVEAHLTRFTAEQHYNLLLWC